MTEPTTPAKRHRWPGGTAGDQVRQPGHGTDADHMARVVQGFGHAVGDMTKLLAKLEPAQVLDTRTVILDGSGQAAAQFRLPFAAVHITSLSQSVLTITAQPSQNNAPTNGAGVGLIGIRAVAAFNIGGYAWNLYGGTPGEQVTVQTFSKTILPSGGPGAYGTTGVQVSQQFANPAAGANFVYTAPAGAPTRIISATGQLTTSAAVANRFFQVQIKDAGGNILAQFGNFTATPASTSLRITVATGVTQANSGAGLAVVPNAIPLLQPGWQLVFFVSAADVADQLSAISLVTQQ